MHFRTGLGGRTGVTGARRGGQRGGSWSITLSDGSLVENPTVNAFVAVDEARARDAAGLIDAKVAAGRDPGPLAGIPLGVKDLEDAAGFVTTHGSPAFAQDPRRHGGLSTSWPGWWPPVAWWSGRPTLPSSGWKADTDNPVFGPTLNPWNP